MYNGNYLIHHGILGQKWGKRNGPPYPLGASDHSASEKKAGWQKSLDKPSAKAYHEMRRQKPHQTTPKVSEQDERPKKAGLSDKQKRVLKIGAAVAVTALAVYGGYQLKQSGKLDPLINKGKQTFDQVLNRGSLAQMKAGAISDIEYDHGFRKMAEPESISKTLLKVNPLRNTPDGTNNCSYCAIASFLRQIGYDVVAKSTGGKMQNMNGIIEECFKGAKTFDGIASNFGKSKEDAARILRKKFGDNASGTCSVPWKDGGGHIFNWKIEDGIVSFFDGQQGRGDSFISRKYFPKIDLNGRYQIARLDGAEIIWDAIGACIRNR